MAQIEAAADEWLKEPRLHFRQPMGPHKSRKRFVNVATSWLRFLGRLREPDCSPPPHADIGSTQRYLTLTPELLSQASNRFEQYGAQGGVL